MDEDRVITEIEWLIANLTIGTRHDKLRREKAEVSPISDTSKTSVSSKMPNPMKIRTFHGRQDGREDPRDYVEDIEEFVKREYADQIAVNERLRERDPDVDSFDTATREIFAQMQHDIWVKENGFHLENSVWNIM